MAIGIVTATPTSRIKAGDAKLPVLVSRWAERALKAIEENNSDRVAPGSLSRAYSALPSSTRYTLLKTSPFRLCILHALRALANREKAQRTPLRATWPPSQRWEQVLERIMSVARRAPSFERVPVDPRIVHVAGFSIVASGTGQLGLINSMMDDAIIREVVFGALSRYCSTELAGRTTGISGFDRGNVEMLEVAFGTLRSLPRILDALTKNVSLLFLATDSTRTSSGNLISAHHPLVPNAFFLSEEAFTDTENIIELMYHEALHNELETSSLIWPCYAQSANPAKSPIFTRSWGDVPFDNDWTLDRAFHAHYVYFHLTDFLACRVNGGGLSRRLKTRTIDRFHAYRDRATLLAQWLLENGKGYLSPLGVRVVERSVELLPAAERSSLRKAGMVSLFNISH